MNTETVKHTFKDKAEANAHAEREWAREAMKHLQGRKIVSCRYLTATERTELGWAAGAIVLELDNGVKVYPSQDDEGNNAGALFIDEGKENPTIPVIWQ